MKNSRAFTLIELLVVISIIAILASATFAFTADAKHKGQDAQITTEKNQVKNALEIYASTKGGYPNPTPGQSNVYCVGGTGCQLYSNGLQYTATNQLSDISIGSFNLPVIGSGGGANQGILYQSCGSLETTCPAATTADVLNPSSSTVARIIATTNSSGSTQTFVGTWTDSPLPSTYNPAAPSPAVTADMWVVWHGSTLYQGTTNNHMGVVPNQSYTVAWTSQNASSCTVSGTTNGSVTYSSTALSGSMSDGINVRTIIYPVMQYIPDTKNYSLSCSNGNSSASDSLQYP
jgi:prepilin-type N-terminal cleavage/methylation domain-containing protein